ncbi:GCG_CRPN prefix-to-repeats domain-containing protein [Xanthobacter sp. AM11]|uniref:GCG_CRPN prefix-to-repeats domain-containing protein n=1 Tax=Xanthobacter sp. AM11 TaxID=3380643 RepID=UPI0039BFE60D
MRKMIVLAAALGFTALGAGAALALPVPQALVASGIAAPDGTPVEQVAQGCGIGFHRGPWGGCRPNYWGPAPYWGPRYCWWRPGPWGPVRVCR